MQIFCLITLLGVCSCEEKQRMEIATDVNTQVTINFDKEQISFSLDPDIKTADLVFLQGVITQQTLLLEQQQRFQLEQSRLKSIRSLWKFLACLGILSLFGGIFISKHLK